MGIIDQSPQAFKQRRGAYFYYNRATIGLACAQATAVRIDIGLVRAPIMCSHFPHGNEHEITCLARRFLASCTAFECNHEPRNSLLSPSLSRNSAAHVVAVSFFHLSSLEVEAYTFIPSACCLSSRFELLYSSLV